MSEISWSPRAKEIFDKAISNLPQFHRTIAERLVKESAEELAKSRGGSIVEENDLVKAFHKEVPPAFRDMMKRLFNKLGVEYKEE